MSSPGPSPRPLDRETLRELKAVSAWRSVGSIAWTWGWIAACFVTYALVPHPLVIAAGVVVISGRQLALAVLMHEGAHGLLLRDRRRNDRLSDWLCGYPLLVSTDAYRQIHLQHHKHTGTERDPDLGLAAPFPVSRASFRRKVLRDLAGITGVRRYAFLLKAYGLRSRTVRGFAVTNAALLAASWAAGIWEAYLLLWLLPSLTGYSLVLRLRSIAEHAAVPDRPEGAASPGGLNAINPSDPLRQTRTTLAHPLVRFFIAPHNVGFHLEHHLYMYVPHYRLRRLHRLLDEAGALDGAEIARGYRSVWRAARSAPAT